MLQSHAYNCSYTQGERVRQASITSPPASQIVAPPISTSGAEGGVGRGGGGGGSGKVDLLGDLGADPFGMNNVAVGTVFTSCSTMSTLVACCVGGSKCTHLPHLSQGQLYRYMCWCIHECTLESFL